jgi:hypothetical protein
MRSVEVYPVTLRCDGLRARPVRVALMANGLWRVDWIGGLVSLYRADPSGHLKLGYEPRHLRWWQPAPERDQKNPSHPIVGHGLRR